MNGGKLVQNVSNHGVYGTHSIMGFNNMIYEITSTHHQMQYPFNLNPKDYDLLYIADGRSLKYEGSGINRTELVINGEPEIVLYHKENMPKCLAIQGHPEYMRKDAPVVKMLNTLINNTLKTLK